MSFAFAESPATTSPGNTALGVLFIAAIVAFVIYRKRKKNGNVKSKAAKHPNSNVVVTAVSSVPGASFGTHYGEDPSLISIAKFQKYVFNRFVVFDFETTGLDPENDRIVEIGAVRVEKGEITQTYQALVNPGIPISAKASKKNHITDDMVSGRPSIKEVLPSFMQFVGDDVLVAHNAAFDAAFLRAACSRCRRKAPDKFFDTMRLNVYWPNLPNRKLESFLNAAGIKNEAAHRALGDAEATAKLVIKTFDKIK